MKTVNQQWAKATVGLRLNLSPAMEACHQCIAEKLLFIAVAAQGVIIKYHDDVFSETMAKECTIDDDQVWTEQKVKDIRKAHTDISKAYRWIAHVNGALGSFAMLATVHLLHPVPVPIQCLYMVSQFCHDSIESQLLTSQFDVERGLCKESDHCMRAALEAKKISDRAN